MSTDEGSPAAAGRSWRKVAIAAVAAVALVAVGGLVWRARAPVASGPAALVVGDQRGGAQALLKAAGELDHVPYRIDWAIFPAASPLLEALASGAIDTGGIGGQPFAFAYASGAKIKVIYAGRLPAGHGGRTSAIVVAGDSALKRVEDLRGKKIATVRGSAGQDLALQLLERHGLGAKDVTWIYLNNSEAKAALAAGSIDAWSTWGAYVGVALLKDKDRTIGDARELPSQAGFYAANEPAIATKRAQLQDFVARLSRARIWLQSHPHEYARVLSRETGLPEDVALLTVEDLLTTPIPVDDNLRVEQEAILERYRKAGIITKVPDLNGAFDPSFNKPAG
ncbi:ABC transporter substrate-binding protein [Novosphingobium sp. FKTRR1]|uniref:ABC transporter substrate-binding protein n=1 Tax=Novosphingobium sp. FKTRR1 TaxID=2879118 RepID=UPI001CEFC0FC|nr:ABC transporter substrate-binding protein [Novosphingobium sp. FKTRR1]